MSRGVHIGVCPECGRTVHVMPTPIRLAVLATIETLTKVLESIVKAKGENK